MEAASHSLGDYIAIALRRKYYILGVWIFVSIAAALTAYYLPRTYRSTATLLMEAPVPSSVVQSMLSEFAEDQLHAITQKVMTTDNLLSIVEDHHLYPDAGDNGEPSRYDRVDQFRKDTEIRLVKSDLGGKEITGQTSVAFTISFLYRDAQIARDVAGMLANLFIHQNDRERAQRALRTSAFLTEESEKLSRDIKLIDGKIASYKKQYKDSLPEQMQANLSALDRAESESKDTEHRIRIAQERLTFLGVELARIQTELPEAADHKVPLTREDQLKLLKAEYLKALGRYTPSHPDVIRLKRQIETMDSGTREYAYREYDMPGRSATRGEAPMPAGQGDTGQHRQISGRQSRAEAPEFSAGPSQGDTGIAERSTSPLYLSIKTQYQSSRIELESLQQEKIALKAKLEILRQRIASSPDIEQGYLEITREREHAVNKYNQLKEKLLDARLVETLEKEQHGQTLTIIEQPAIPTRPEKAIRRKVAVGGFFLGMALGLGCALLLEYMDPRIRGYRALAQATGLIPLAVIPYIEVPDEIEAKLARQRHGRKALAWTGTAGAVIVMMLIGLSLPPHGTRQRVADNPAPFLATAHGQAPENH